MSEQTKSKTILRIIVTQEFNLQSNGFIKTISETVIPYSSRYELAPDMLDLEVGLLSLKVQNREFEIELISPYQGHPAYKNSILIDYHQVDKISSVVIVDNKAPEIFMSSRSLMQTCQAFTRSTGVFALINFEESQGRWDFEQWWKRRPPTIDAPIVDCVLSDKQSVANVLIALCEEVLKDIEEDEQDAPTSTS